MSLDLELEGVEQALGRVRAWERETLDRAEKVLDRTALNVSRKAKRGAPVDTGRLRASIEVERTAPLQREVQVGHAAHVNYAAFQEFGTGQRGRASAIDPPAAYEYGRRRGIPAQPFLTPAWRSERPRYIRAMREALNH